MTTLFFHGVPDTPAIWQPLIKALDLADGTWRAPNLPGFGVPLPTGFVPTKEAYLAWMLDELERAASDAKAPVNIIAHDWGAILAQRAVHTRPDLVNFWIVSGAVIEPSYRWHRTARLWQTPLLGEFSMAATSRGLLKRALVKAGLPADIAANEAAAFNTDMKRAILGLYRSAKTIAKQWGDDLGPLPPNGYVIWGEADPYVSEATAKTFCEAHSLPLYVHKNSGHWAIAEDPGEISVVIQHHWANCRR